MLSANCGLASAPDGDSVTVVKPFQANPSLYAPDPSGMYRTPWSTPVSYRRSPTWSHARAVMCFLAFPLEEYLVYVVIQVVGRIKSIKCTRRQLCNLVWYVAVRISI